MFDSHHLKSRNPYDAKLGTQLLNKPGSVLHIPPAVAHRIDAVTDSHFLLVR